jgi:hypothetical protein
MHASRARRAGGPLAADAEGLVGDARYAGASRQRFWAVRILVQTTAAAVLMHLGANAAPSLFLLITLPFWVFKAVGSETDPPLGITQVLAPGRMPIR